jgi:dTDP-4-amino-4,6-dideoxygalactose transaminase
LKIFDLKFDNKDIKFFKKNIDNIFKAGFFSNHNYVKIFEENFRKHYNFKYSIATTSATSSLEVILKALNVKNKKVLVNSNTFIATAHAISNAGGIIVPVDLDNKYFCMSYNDLKKKISKNVGAVVIVHIGGLITPKIMEIVNLCKINNVPLIEDAAQSQGSKFSKMNSGSFGIASAFSFHTTKVMSTGEGGMIVTSDKSIYEKCFSLRQFGFATKNNLLHDKVGGNYKFNEFSALLGVIDLKRVDKRIKKRNIIANIYQRFLNKEKYNCLFANKNKGAYCNHYKQIVLSKISRYKIQNILKQNNIPLTGGVYYVPLHRQPIYKRILKNYLLPNTDYFCNNHFCPPCYPELKLKEVKKIVEILNAIK